MNLKFRSGRSIRRTTRALANQTFCITRTSNGNWLYIATRVTGTFSAPLLVLEINRSANHARNPCEQPAEPVPINSGHARAGSPTKMCKPYGRRLAVSKCVAEHDTLIRGAPNQVRLYRARDLLRPALNQLETNTQASRQSSAP
jgi:hypothetical protein